MTNREKHLDWLYRLKSNLKIFIPKDFHLEQFEQSLDYAISSIKTDLKYDLMYESENDHEILKAHSDGAREALDKVREEIEQLEMYGVLFSDKQTAIHIDKAKVLEIIDKYRKVE